VRLTVEFDTNRQDTSSPERGSFFGEVKREVSPYLQALISDFIITICLWLALFIFEWVTHFLPINGSEGNTARVVHSASTILALSTFGLIFIVDVIIITIKRIRH